MISHELKTEKQTMAADPDSGPGPGQYSRRHPGTAALHARDQTEHFEEAGAAHKPRGLLLFMKPNRANFPSPRRPWGTPRASKSCRHKPGGSIEMHALNRMFHTPSNVLLTPWLQPGEKCDEVAINCFNSTVCSLAKKALKRLGLRRGPKPPG